jgi:RNA polymerase sigma factor (sigma-70 family)
MGTGSESDGELWLRAQSGDGRAFGELFERHADAVYNHCFRRTASWSQAQDLTSVVFLEAWRKRKAVRLVGDSIRPLLLAVANNVMRNASRAAGRYERFLARIPKPPESEAFSDEVDRRLDEERSMRLLLDYLDELRIEEREALSLCYWSGLSYEEAAAALGVPVGTIRSRLSRARRHLKALATDDDPPVPITLNRAEEH